VARHPDWFGTAGRQVQTAQTRGPYHLDNKLPQPRPTPKTARERLAEQLRAAEAQYYLDPPTDVATPAPSATGGVGGVVSPPPTSQNPAKDAPKQERPKKVSQKKPSGEPAQHYDVQERRQLTKNPKKLKYHRSICEQAQVALRYANAEARGSVERLILPRQVYQLLHDIADTTDALAGALDWVRRARGPAVALEVEAACLYRVRGGVQVDDWSCLRARRKAQFLVLALMSPHELHRRDVTGSPSDEVMLVTAGVPQTLMQKLLRSGQREVFCKRTLQRDLAEIEECTDMLLRWRTPAAHAQPWERKSDKGVLNRYCVRADMIRQQWRRCRNDLEALAKGTMLKLASWMVWRPAPPRGQPVAMAGRGGRLAVPS
jgi:hypothetical protein